VQDFRAQHSLWLVYPKETAGISVSTLDRLVKEGGVPKKLVRGNNKFPKIAFDLWCNQPDEQGRIQ